MSSYDTLRHFADSWGLLAMTLAFLGIVLFAFRPGARRVHADSAGIPFRHEDRPAGEGRPDACTGCGDCGGRCNDISARLEP